MIDNAQTQEPVLPISNLRDQSEELCQSQRPFWQKALFEI